ncbi:MAG: hypothetical protein M0Z51_12080 [Propionibacterium sp.]|nr:hypothetical protein [Propionibacterium sp.]
MSTESLMAGYMPTICGRPVGYPAAECTREYGHSGDHWHSRTHVDMAAHDAQVKAEAWDEGAEMGHRLYAESIYTIRARNPYRAAETEATR